MEMGLISRSEKKQNQPFRMCCVCRIQALKITLNRFVLEKDKPILDEYKNKAGRGAYCCNNKKCLAAFLSQQKRWEKALKVEKNPSVMKS